MTTTVTTPSTITSAAAERIRRAIQAFDFRRLFVEELGWDNFKGQPLRVEVGGETYTLTPVASKRGVGVFACAPNAEGGLPNYATRKKIDAEVVKLHREHIIVYTDKDDARQIWQWVRRGQGKPTAYREQPYAKGQSGERLAQSLAQLYVDLGEEESLSLTEAAGRVQKAFDVDKVTKRFYDRFQKEHDTFLAAIEGIAAAEDRAWYASLTLNRLMFTYFIQSKRFLDGDPAYLRTKLAQTQARFGADQFYAFYREFLLVFFHHGLGEHETTRPAVVRALIGSVPYLNGGLFELHEIERANPAIAIPDAAFTRIFDFFDEWNWQLDDRPDRPDNEINPDVLGFIFEKYINQKQMGAYYTKEDITGYIGKNTILPWLLEVARKDCAIAFAAEGEVWRLLRDDPDRYIYPAVRHGVDLTLPPEIAAGLADVAQRGGWNRPAADGFALPTETWREHVARRTRCLELRAKLAEGAITQVNDLITYNLDIVTFAQDVIERCEGPETLRAIWKALASVTVLDPTCGSGAFLFAALRLLEPLYETCLLRMTTFVAEFDRAGETRKAPDFREVLARMAEHPNRPYFIRKSIILNNLYGVDIMEEAVEIAKLRLFLALISQAETVGQIEPLPDIDFNIRAGNTLVGFATLAEARRAVSGNILWFQQMPQIEQDAEELSRLFDRFREQQTTHGGRVTKEDKAALRAKLAALGDTLDRFLAADYGIDASHLTDPAEYAARLAAWRASHQPFHWFLEFYAIVHAHGGFDVIIGNPPYVEYSKVQKEYKVRGYTTESCGNLYALTLERSGQIQCQGGVVGMIVPMSLVCTSRMAELRKNMYQNYPALWLDNYDTIPATLFTGIVQRNTIVIGFRNKGAISQLYTTRTQKWYTDLREHLFALVPYLPIAVDSPVSLVPKISDTLERSILAKVDAQRIPISAYTGAKSSATFSYKRRWSYFLLFVDHIEGIQMPDGSIREQQDNKTLSLASDVDEYAIISVLSSDLFYLRYSSYSDFRHVNISDFDGFRFDYRGMTKATLERLERLGRQLMQSYTDHLEWRDCNYVGSIGECRVPFYRQAPSKPIIDEIDRVLAQHYGFTDEELDFIINYDIKYRMGAGGEADGDANGEGE